MGSRARTAFFSTLALATVVAPWACFYPDYSFNEPGGETGGGGAGPGPSTGGSGPGPGPGGGPGSSSSGGGAGAEGGGGGASSSTGVGGNLGEDCTDGTDDDSDGKADCEDTECTDHSCVGSIPAGWTGYFALYDGAPASDPGCPADYPTDSFTGNTGLQAPAAACSACGCSNPTGQSCNFGMIFVRDAACGMNPTLVGSLSGPPASGLCSGPDGFNSGDMECGPSMTAACNVSVGGAPPTVLGGSCSANGGTPTITPPTFTVLGRACGGVVLTGAGCNASQVCLPKPDPADYQSGVCISQDGVHSCTGTGAFLEQHIFYSDVMDNRGCSPCACGSPVGSSCNGSITMYSDQTINTCTTPVATFPAGGCADLTGNPAVVGRKATVTQQPTGGFCAANGGQPTGMATAISATTFCCIP